MTLRYADFWAIQMLNSKASKSFKMNINLFKDTKAYFFLYLSIEKRKKRRLEYCNAIELELFILNVLIRYWFEIFFGLKRY